MNGTLGGLSKYRNNMQKLPTNSPDWSQADGSKTLVVGAMMKILGNEEKQSSLGNKDNSHARSKNDYLT